MFHAKGRTPILVITGWWTGAAAWVALWLCLSRPAFGAPPISAPSRIAQLRDGAREILKANCGSCHDGALSTAKPAALKVFDLQELEWAAGMSDQQLGRIIGRFQSFGVPRDDRKRVKAFIKAELARRAQSREAEAKAEAASKRIQTTHSTLAFSGRSHSFPRHPIAR
jgi:hypothetical protein